MRTYEELNEVDQEIGLLIRAKFPILSVITYEEQRVLTQLEGIREVILRAREQQLRRQLEIVQEDKRPRLRAQLDRLPQAHQVLWWSCTNGLMHWSRYEGPPGEEVRAPVPLPLPVPRENPLAVLSYLLRPDAQAIGGVDPSTAILVFSDLHSWLDREDRASRFNHMLVRLLRDLVTVFKFSEEPRSLVLLSPRTVVPAELSKDVQVIDYPLPTVDQLRRRFAQLRPRVEARYGPEALQLSPQAEERLMRALSGLTYDEVENVLAKSLAGNGCLQEDDIREALDEKRQIIQKDGILEYFESATDRAHVGGLELLLQWLDQRHAAFTGGTFRLGGRELALPVPKGILLIGVPGGGKSLVAKAVGNAWGLPLLRLDVGRIFGGIVGQSEENMRRAIRMAESVAPAVVWLDEVEKAFPKVSGATDSGVSLRVMNTFLTWMQEKRAPVFVVATGNDISQVPPELTRKGRFDEIFYVGLPNTTTRKQIFRIHTNAWGLGLGEDHLSTLADQSLWYTGAEIEQVVKNALYQLPRFLEDAGDPQQAVANAISYCMTDFVPLVNREGPDGRGLVETMLQKAKAIATPASEEFEELERRGALSPIAAVGSRFRW